MQSSNSLKVVPCAACLWQHIPSHACLVPCSPIQLSAGICLLRDLLACGKTDRSYILTRNFSTSQLLLHLSDHISRTEVDNGQSERYLRCKAECWVEGIWQLSLEGLIYFGTHSSNFPRENRNLDQVKDTFRPRALSKTRSGVYQFFHTVVHTLRASSATT